MKAKGDISLVIKEYFAKSEKDNLIILIKEKIKNSEKISNTNLKKLEKIYAEFHKKYKDYSEQEEAFGSYVEKLEILNKRLLICLNDPTYSNILNIFNDDLKKTAVGYQNYINQEIIVPVEMIQQTRLLALSQPELNIFDANTSISNLFKYSIETDSFQDRIREKIWLILYLVIHTTKHDRCESVDWAESIISEIERLTSKNISEFGIVAEKIHLIENRTFHGKGYESNWDVLDKIKEENFDLELMYEVAWLNANIELLKAELELSKSKKESFLNRIINIFK